MRPKRRRSAVSLAGLSRSVAREARPRHSPGELPAGASRCVGQARHEVWTTRRKRPFPGGHSEDSAGSAISPAEGRAPLPGQR